MLVTPKIIVTVKVLSGRIIHNLIIRKKKKKLILTIEDYKCLVREEIQLIEIINAKSYFERPPFVVLENVDSNQVKCF